LGEIVYIYTRAHAIADGAQIDVSKVAAEAGIRFPVYLTRTVYDAYVTVPPAVEGQDEPGRLGTCFGAFDLPSARHGLDKTASRSRSMSATTTAARNWSNWWPVVARETWMIHSLPLP